MGIPQTGAQAEYKKVVNKLRIHVQSLEQIDLNFFDEESIYYRYLNQSHPEVSKQIQDFVQKTEIYRQSIITAIQNKALIVIQDIPEVSASLDSIIASLNNELNKLRSDEGTKQLLAELKNQQLQLKHRRLLGQHLPQVEKYVETRQWIKKLKKWVEIHKK